MATPRAVVILDPAFLGDVVFDGPLVRALHAADPSVRVGLLVRPPADAIARRIVGVDRVHCYDKYRADRGLAGLRRIAAELAEARYDTALIPHPSARTTLLARWAGIPRRVGNAASIFSCASSSTQLKGKGGRKSPSGSCGTSS